MAGWEEVVFKGSPVGDLGLVGVAEGDILVAGSTPFTFAVLTKGTDGHTLTAGASTISWTAAGTGDFKADGTVPMTDALQLTPNAGEGGMTTNDGAIFFDTTADKLKVYVA